MSLHAHVVVQRGALLVDVDPDAKWLQLFLGDEPVFKVKDPNRPKRFGKNKHPAAVTTSPPAESAPA